MYQRPTLQSDYNAVGDERFNKNGVLLLSGLITVVLYLVIW